APLQGLEPLPRHLARLAAHGRPLTRTVPGAGCRSTRRAPCGDTAQPGVPHARRAGGHRRPHHHRGRPTRPRASGVDRGTLAPGQPWVAARAAASARPRPAALPHGAARLGLVGTGGVGVVDTAVRRRSAPLTRTPCATTSPASMSAPPVSSATLGTSPTTSHAAAIPTTGTSRIHGTTAAAG